MAKMTDRVEPQDLDLGDEALRGFCDWLEAGCCRRSCTDEDCAAKMEARAIITALAEQA